MGLWIKNADGTIERTAGGGADGQPGVDGEDGQPGADGNMWHVGSGAPASTLGEPGDYYLDGTDGWVYVKRNDSSWTNLYVNLTGPPGDSGGGDFLPLSGGTLTGDLQVEGAIDSPALRLKNDGEVLSLMNLTPTGQPHLGMYHNGVRKGYLGNATATTTELSAETNQLVLGGAGVRVAYTDLQVDGQIKPQANGTPSAPGILFGTDGSGVYGANDFVGFTQGGTWQLSVTSDQVRIKPDLQVDGKINGQSVFGIADGIDTRDVLDRAEVAIMPAPDEAVVDGLTVNEVVTALLLKVKELSARIETLEGQKRLIE